jgi:hypothetical protein
MGAARAPRPQWRYSVRWALPHKPCPGAHELASVLVDAGAPIPEELARVHVLGGGYAVHIDFPPAGPVRRWSPEAKARTRQRNLAARLQRHAPLFADQLYEREVAARPEYFAGAAMPSPASINAED